jgi:hypothetical protein
MEGWAIKIIIDPRTLGNDTSHEQLLCLLGDVDVDIDVIG